MGLLKKIGYLLRGGNVHEKSILERVLDAGSDGTDAGFTCILCGATFERNYRECPECGGKHVAKNE